MPRKWSKSPRNDLPPLAKAGKKIKAVPTRVLPPDANPFADWSSHLFTADRAQYIILTNTASLYSVLMHGRGVSCDSEFLARGLSCLREFMLDDGQGSVYEQFIAPSAATVQFSKPLNRSIIGSINELVFHAKMWLTVRELSPYDTSFKLNEIAMSPLDYANPRASAGTRAGQDSLAMCNTARGLAKMKQCARNGWKNARDREFAHV